MERGGGCSTNFFFFLFKSYLGEGIVGEDAVCSLERFNYCLIIDWKIRGRQCEVRRTKIKLSYGFLSVIEDGRFEKEIGWNVVKEDFKVGENGEGGERGGGLILG